MVYMIAIILVMSAYSAYASFHAYYTERLIEIHTKLPSLFDTDDVVISVTDPNIIYKRELRYEDLNSVYDPVRYRYIIKDGNLTVYTGGDWFYNLNQDAIVRYSKIIKSDLRNITHS